MVVRVNLVFCDSHIIQQVQYHLSHLYASFLQFVIFLRLKFDISNPTIAKSTRVLILYMNRPSFV